MKRRNFLWYACLFIAGCSATTRSTTEAGPEKLRFAVTDVIDPEKVQRDYGSFQTALATVLEREVELFPMGDMLAAASALKFNQLDLALAGPSEYVVIQAKTKAIPLIAITRPNYRSLMVAAADSGISSVADLKGKVLALSDVGSTSGHLGPTKLLVDAGLNPKSDLEIRMLGDEGSMAALRSGEVDAWGGAAHDYETFLREDESAAKSFPLIAAGPPLPSDIFVANSQLLPALVDELRSRMVDQQAQLIQALATGESTRKYKNSKLVTANDADYDMIRDVYKAIGEGSLIQGET